MRRLGLLISLAAAAVAAYAAVTRKQRRPSADEPHPEMAAHANQSQVETESPSAVPVESAAGIEREDAPPPQAPDPDTGARERDESTAWTGHTEDVVDSGVFAIGGWAAAPGHSVVSAVTYRTRLDTSVSADRIMLTIETQENVPDGGLIILTDPGFEPDREGFTILLAAADPGPFSASGSYQVIG